MQQEATTYKKPEKSRIIYLEKGKIPPQALDLEEAVLGAMLIDHKGCIQALDILSADAFYDSKHQQIFKAIEELFHKSQPIDLLTVSNQLKTTSKLDISGGDFYLVRLTQAIASSAHIEFHSRVILQKKIQRDLIVSASEMIENAYDEEADVFDLLEIAYSKLNEIAKVTEKKKEQKKIKEQAMIKEAVSTRTKEEKVTEDTTDSCTLFVGNLRYGK